MAVTVAPRHYLLRTSWVVGDGGNFVAMMTRLADGGVSPSVVDDQWGRLSFADEIAAATMHLVQRGAPLGTYNVSQSGEPMTWAAIAREVFALRGRSTQDVTAVTTHEYGASEETAPRPVHSTLDLTKLAPPDTSRCNSSSTGASPEHPDQTLNNERCFREDEVRPGAFEVARAATRALVGNFFDPGSASILDSRGIAHERLAARRIPERIMDEVDLVLSLEVSHRKMVLSYSPTSKRCNEAQWILPMRESVGYAAARTALTRWSSRSRLRAPITADERQF